MPAAARTPVITGCGVISPYGRGVASFWTGLLSGRTAAAPIAGFPADDLQPRIAAEVREPAQGDRAGHFALVAAAEATAQAGLVPGRIDPCRLGVAMATTLGGMEVFEAWDAAADRGMPPPPHLDVVPYYAPGVRLATTVGAAGPVVTAQLACASGTQAVALAADWIRSGRADVVLAGGSDLLCRFVVAGFNALHATAEVARPFDRDRQGLVLGEGAGVLVVEDPEHAARRGAVPLARLLGVGAAADAVHMTAPDREGGGAARAMRAALAAAGLSAAAVDFVSAHGTGTVYNDAMETAALAAVFGETRVPVNSIKGAIGHTLGAAGVFEAVMCVEVLRHGLVPPTAGLEHVDPACAGLDLVHDGPRQRPARVALSSSSGFAGANAALVFGAA